MGSKNRSGSRARAWVGTGRRRAFTVGAISLLALAGPAYEALAAQPAVGLGTAGSFAVLAGSGVTNTGPSTLNGDLGVSPGTAVTGFPPGTVRGATHAADAAASQAQSDLTTAYNDAAGRTPVVTESGDLGGLTLTSGVYRSSSSLGLTGTLTLDAQGNSGAVFIIQAASTLTTASASSVQLINGAQPCNVFWQVGSSATLGSTSVFVGNLLAYTSISMNDGVTLEGRALARNGAVTLINDTVTPAACAASTGTTTTGTGTTGTSGGTGTPVASPPTPGRGVVRAHRGTAVLAVIPRVVQTTIQRYGTGRCIAQAFRVTVSGRFIRQVVFRLGAKLIGRARHAPFAATVTAVGGTRVITARVTFTDATHPVVRRLRYRACAAAQLPTPPVRKPITTVGFTG